MMDDSHKVGKAVTEYHDKNGKPVQISKKESSTVGKAEEQDRFEKTFVSRKVEK